MHRFVIATGIGIIVSAALATACTVPTLVPTPLPSATPMPSPKTTPVVVDTPTPLPFPTGKPTASPAATPTPTLAPAPLAFFLEVLAPKNETVVNASPVEVRGRTVPDAIVSVNGYGVEVDANGNFSTRLTLEEGPNSLEVVASDFRGHQESQVVTFVYVRP